MIMAELKTISKEHATELLTKYGSVKKAIENAND